MPWETTEQYIRSGHGAPGRFAKDSMRTITISESKGIKAIVGCPKGGYRGGRCQVGMETQSYLFEKKKWTMARAKAWFKKHKAKGKKKEQEEITKALCRKPKKQATPFDLPLGQAIFDEVKEGFQRMDQGWYHRPGQRPGLKGEGPAAFCVKCRKKVTIKNPKTSGKKTTGVCPTCGTKVTAFQTKKEEEESSDVTYLKQRLSELKKQRESINQKLYPKSGLSEKQKRKLQQELVALRAQIKGLTNMIGEMTVY